MMIALLAACLGTPALAQPALSEFQVRQYIQRMDDAIEQQDAQTVRALLDEQVIIRLTYSHQDVSQEMRMTREEYVLSLEQAWALASNYSYNRSHEQISISGDQAIVTSRAAEVMTIQGQSVSAVTDSRVTLRLVEGRLLAVQLEGHARM